jgi:hypothetical protein
MQSIGSSSQPGATPRGKARAPSPAGMDAYAQLAVAMEHYRDDPDFVTALAHGLSPALGKLLML